MNPGCYWRSGGNGEITPPPGRINCANDDLGCANTLCRRRQSVKFAIRFYRWSGLNFARVAAFLSSNIHLQMKPPGTFVNMLFRAGLLALAAAWLPAAEPEKLWQLSLSQSDGDVSPRTDDRISIRPDGVIIVGSLGGTLNAVSPGGSNLWEVNVGRLYSSVPIAKDGTVIFTSYDGTLKAYGTNGQSRWNFPIERSNPGSPGIGMDGTVYTAGRELYAVNPDGTKKWAYPAPTGLSRVSCAQGPEGTIFVTDVNSAVHAVNSDGTLKWALTIPGCSGTTLEVSREGILHLVANRKLHAIRPDGTAKWVLNFQESPGSLARVADDGTVYLVSGVKLTAVSADGKPKWNYELDSSNTKIPLLGHDGVIYTGTTQGKVHAINPDGSKRWVYDAGSAITANFAQDASGVLYFEAKGILFALNTGKPAQPNPVARFRRDDNFHPERFQTPAKPAAPEIVTAAKAQSLTGVAITWSPAPRASSYEIWRAEKADPAGAVALIKNVAGTTNYEDRTAQEGVVYHYWVKAINAAGASDFGKPDTGSARGKTAGDVIWEVNVGAPIHSTPAQAQDGTVYVGTRGQKLVAVSSAGKIAWQYATGGDVDSSPVIGGDGTIYVGAHDRKLHAIKPDGTRKWEFATGGFITASPAIGPDGTIYIGSWDRKVYALKSDGTKRWEAVLPDSVVASPAVGADGTVYVGCDDGNLYALGTDGKTKWGYTAGGAVHGAVAISGDTLFLGAPDHCLHALTSDGRKKWALATKQPVTGSPVVGADSVIYFTGGDCRLYALNPDGGKRWEYDASATPATALALGADGSAHLGYADGRLRVLDQQGGLKWSFPANGAITGSPIIGARGTVMFGTAKGWLYAVKGAPGAGERSWPMHRANLRHTAEVSR